MAGVGRLSDLVAYLWDLQLEHGDMAIGVDEDMAPYGLSYCIADPEEYPEYQEKTLVFAASDPEEENDEAE